MRSALHRRGLRFRKHVKTLPGTPDVVFLRTKVVVFVDGDFWHGYGFEEEKDRMSLYWREKIARNIERDNRNFVLLRDTGWEVVRVRKHEIKKDLNTVVDRIAAVVTSRADTT